MTMMMSTMTMMMMMMMMMTNDRLNAAIPTQPLQLARRSAVTACGAIGFSHLNLREVWAVVSCACQQMWSGWGDDGGDWRWWGWWDGGEGGDGGD
eukprot:8894619-Karenia_brevis.AAC.1